MDFPDFLSKNVLQNVREITESLRLPCKTCCDWMLHWNDYFGFGCFICLVCYSERTSFEITKYVKGENTSTEQDWDFIYATLCNKGSFFESKY